MTHPQFRRKAGRAAGRRKLMLVPFRCCNEDAVGRERASEGIQDVSQTTNGRSRENTQADHRIFSLMLNP